MAPAAITAAMNMPPAAGPLATAAAVTTTGVEVVVVGRPDAVGLVVADGARVVAKVDGVTDALVVGYEGTLTVVCLVEAEGWPEGWPAGWV